MSLQAFGRKYLEHRHTKFYQGLLYNVMWYFQSKHWKYSMKDSGGYLIENNAFFTLKQE
jgi:hypothetical protein